MFKLITKFNLAGDQEQAVERLCERISSGKKFNTLLGVTGSGKTFTIANVISRLNIPVLVISHNKTLAAQLYGEFKSFFPENSVEYFISYYDYYQPEAYIPETDTYIEKDASINEDIDRLRLKATTSLLEREDVIVVSSVSCIYGLGKPEDFKSFIKIIKKGDLIKRDELLRELIEQQYVRNDIEFIRGTFRVKGDIVDIFPSYEKYGTRIEFFGDEIDEIYIFDPVSGHKLKSKESCIIYPAKHFVTPYPKIETAIMNIEKELEERIKWFLERGKYLEAQRIEARTRYDLELLREMGYCPGIENYSMHLSGRKPGERPACLIDYFPEKFLCVIDESHVTVPQLRGMFNGDRARKETLVEYGFRLPSALENRPLKFEEFIELVPYIIFVSATPDEYEIQMSGEVVEQIIRPTGLVDPEVVIKSTKNQIDDLIEEIKERVKRNERVLVTTLTKRMAEDLAEYLFNLGIRVRYIHSEFDAFERVETLRGLRLGEFDVLVGVNLLREGLDLPEVSLVAVLDADKEGFLRSKTSLIQVSGRAARNVSGKVILYADNITDSIKEALKEMERRRNKQIQYNKEHNITPRSIQKTREEILSTTSVADAREKYDEEEEITFTSELERLEKIEEMTKEMHRLASIMEFEKAAKIRDKIRRIMNEQIRERKGVKDNKGSNQGRHWRR
uniref:UvrABC system protein B n=1 Tax=candidate division WOR-3 bacterium TaxID=2052148 RepID=A0A7C4YCH2_UNCW3